MKIDTEILIDIILAELSPEEDKSLQTLFGFFKSHPLIRKSTYEYTLNEVSEIIYTVYFKLKNYDDNKIYDLLSKRVFYTIVSFEGINSEETTCSECDGYGFFRCETCDGSGEIEDSDSDESETCDNCWGDGQVDCDECGGNGRVSGVDEMGYNFHLLVDIQPETIINDMKRADPLTDEFDVEISNSKYEITANSGEFNYLNENDYEYDSKYEGSIFFYEVLNGNEKVDLHKSLVYSLN